MTQKILKVGSSAGVTIPKRVLESLGLRVGDAVEVTLDEAGQLAAIRPAKTGTHSDQRSERIAKLTLDFIDRYRTDLEALANK